MVNCKAGKKDRVISFMHSFSLPHFSKKWDVIVNRSGSFSYRVRKGEKVLPTQSAAFACFLCKLDAFHAIHFEDERWLENMKYAAGDDQLFYYKMHIMGFKIIQYLNSGVLHLDAQAGHKTVKSNKMYLQRKNMFAMWYRTIYNIKSKGRFEKLRCAAAFSWRCIFGVLILPLEVLHYKQPRFFMDYFRGLWAGFRYVCSEEYKNLPAFDAYTK
jgi:hypothetical protein